MARGREERALCFRDLRDVTMAIAGLFILLSLVGIIMSIVVWTALLPQAVTYMDGYNEQSESGYESEDLVTSTAAAVLVVSIIGLLLSIVLLRAAHVGRKRCLLPWLVFYGLLFTLLAVLALISFVLACIAAEWSAIVASVVEIFAAFVLWSWWAAVWAHYYTM